ncbi:MAG: MerR family transcriptional regulator [Dehalococcoidales bacterium]|jgi:predicted site-specific integrase-resolvase|nr:MerR family transcriptional regulator [Dehalococcoidales bacterium]
MAIDINGELFYRTAEACQIAGVSKNTFFRWVKEGLLDDAEYRDRRGWRLFTEDAVNNLKIIANKVNKIR